MSPPRNKLAVGAAAALLARPFPVSPDPGGTLLACARCGIFLVDIQASTKATFRALPGRALTVLPEACSHITAMQDNDLDAVPAALCLRPRRLDLHPTRPRGRTCSCMACPAKIRRRSTGEEEELRSRS